MKRGFQTLMLVLTIGTSAAAQETQVEAQVPMDAKGTLMEITPEWERKLGLFPDVKRFFSARLFQVSDTSYVLEVAYKVNGKLERRRVPMSKTEMEAFRLDVAHRLRARGPKTWTNQEGRGGLIFRQTLLSLSFYGWAMPEIMDISSSRGRVATYMLVTAGGFYVPYTLTKNVPIHHTHRMISFYGATRGIGYGLLLEDLLLREEGSYRSALAFATLGSITGAFMGFKAADWTRLSMGQAELVGVMGDFGIGFGFSTAYVMGLYDDERWQRGADAVILALSGVGLRGGTWLAKREEYTQGDAYVLRAAGILGAHLILPIVDATGTKEGKIYAAGITLGSAAGLAVTNRLLRDRSFSLSEGLIITSGQLAGGLLALGITYLLDTDEEFDEWAYFTTSALGSLGGFTLTFRAVSKQSSKVASATQRIRFNLAPEGIAMAALGKIENIRRGPIPILTASF